MKKLILIFMSLLFISCSQIDAYSDGETKNKMMTKGYNELMTEQEKKDLEAGKSISAVMYKAPFRGALAQGVRNTLSVLGPSQKEIQKAALFIEKYQDKIIASDNTNIIEKAIEYLGKEEKGRNILKNCRFLFLNYVDRVKIEKLSKEFGFKYSYPKVEDVK